MLKIERVKPNKIKVQNYNFPLFLNQIFKTIFQLYRTGKEPWGLEISGDSPVKIKSVRPGTPAAEAGVQNGDICSAVNGVNVCNAKQKEVTALIKSSAQCLRNDFLPKFPKYAHTNLNQ